MLTDQGTALIAELAAAAFLLVAIAGFLVCRARLFLACSIIAVLLLIVCVTTLIEAST